MMGEVEIDVVGPPPPKFWADDAVVYPQFFFLSQEAEEQFWQEVATIAEQGDVR